MTGEMRERKRQLREAEAEQLKWERRSAALPHEFAELRKQAGLAEDAFSTPSISVALEPHSRQRNHTREGDIRGCPISRSVGSSSHLIDKQTKKTSKKSGPSKECDT